MEDCHPFFYLQSYNLLQSYNNFTTKSMDRINFQNFLQCYINFTISKGMVRIENGKNSVKELENCHPAAFKR